MNGAACVHIKANLGQDNVLRMVRWMRWYCPPDTIFEIRALAVRGRARYLSVTEAPHNIESLRVRGEETFVSLKPERQSGIQILHQDSHSLGVPQNTLCTSQCVGLQTDTEVDALIQNAANVIWFVNWQFFHGSEWVNIALCCFLYNQRQTVALSRDYAIPLSNDYKGSLQFKYRRQYCTLQVFEQLGALYMHNLDDRHPTRLGIELWTPTTGRNEPSGPAFMTKAIIYSGRPWYISANKTLLLLGQQ